MKTGYGHRRRRDSGSELIAGAEIEINRARVSMGYLEEARQNHVKKKVEEALRSKMKEKALKECNQYASKYAECAMGKTLSVVWQCRGQAKELNNCLHQFTNDAVLEEMKQAYMDKEKGSIKV